MERSSSTGRGSGVQFAELAREVTRDLADDRSEPGDQGCPKCGGRGWVLIEDGGAGQARRCDCRKASRGGRILDTAGIPERYHDCRLRSFTTVAEKPGIAEQLVRALALSRSYVDDFLRPDGGFADHGLIYLGPAGAGKTHLAAAVTKELIQRYQVRARFVEFTELIHTIQSTFDSSSSASKSSVLDPLINADLLVLDELGAQRTTEWVLDLLYLLINGRYNRRLPTLFTTNCLLQDPVLRRRGEENLDRGADLYVPPRGPALLAERLPANLISRLFEMATPVVMDAVGDFRREVKHNSVVRR